jgi:multiple sugar transport system substrate-binding protein
MARTSRLGRRRFLGLAGLGAAGAVLAACAQTAAPTATSAPSKPAAGAAAAQPTAATGGQPAANAPAKPKDKVALRLWHWDEPMRPSFTQVAEEFNKKLPHATAVLELTPFAEFPQKLAAAVAGGTPPDVSGAPIVGAMWTTFVSNGQIIPLTPYVQRDKYDLEDWPQVILKSHTWKGTLHSLPYAWPTGMIFYNADTFKKQAVKTPYEQWKEGKWTWSAYMETAAKLTKGSGMDKEWGSNVIGAASENTVLPLIWMNGGELFNADYTKPTLSDPPSMGAFQFAFDVRKHAPNPDEAKTGTINSGKLAMWVQWDVWYVLNVGKVPFQYGIAPLPAPDQAANKHIFFNETPAWAIVKGTKAQDDAWELVKHLLTPDSQRIIFYQSNLTPSRKSVTADKSLWEKSKDLPNPGLMYELTQAKEQSNRNHYKVTKWPEMLTSLREETSLAWADKQPLDATLKKVNERWDKLLKESEADRDR